MRRIIVTALAASLVSLGGLVLPAHAQNQERQDAADQAAQEEADRRRRLNREFQRDELPLPELANHGPCPYVKVLYDAARTIDFQGGVQAASAVNWSGEIEGIAATCRYGPDDPITVEMITTFHVGRGPQAFSNEQTFTYWIAVTVRNAAILGKERFTFTATVPAGDDRVLVFDRVDQIVIPRGDSSVSGANFEVLVGFEVTPEMAEFNRQGSRFLPSATGQQAQAASVSAQAQ